METVANLGFAPENRLIGEKNSYTTRYGVYCLDSPTRQLIWTVVGEQKAKMGDFVPLGFLRLRRGGWQDLHLPLVALKGHEFTRAEKSPTYFRKIKSAAKPRPSPHRESARSSFENGAPLVDQNNNGAFFNNGDGRFSPLFPC